MTLDELEQLAKKSIQETPPPFDPKIDLIMPGRWGKNGKKRLVRGGPVGDIVQETKAGLTVIFDARDILEWLGELKREVEEASRNKPQ